MSNLDGDSVRDWPQPPQGVAGFGVACGKLYLMGEFAVMSPHSSALLIGVDKYLSAKAYLAHSATETRLFSSYDPPGGRVLEIHNLGEGDVVSAAFKTAYSVVKHYDREGHGLEISIESDLRDHQSGRKYGLGSSGAITVAILQAVVSAHGIQLSSAQLYKAAMLSFLEAGELGSGGDIACSVLGGITRYRRPDPHELQNLYERNGIAAITQPWPGLILESQPWPDELEVLIGWTGTPAKTDRQLYLAGEFTPSSAQFSAQDFPVLVGKLVDDLWTRIREHPLHAPDLVEFAQKKMRRNRDLLKDFEKIRGTVIETRHLGKLVDVAENLGWAAKSSGAGGGDCGVALGGAGWASSQSIREQWKDAGILSLSAQVCPQRLTTIM